MKKNLTRMKRRGFTLIELVITLVILAIVAAIAIPTFAKLVERSQYSSVKTSAASIEHNALALAAADQKVITDTDANGTGTYLEEAAAEVGDGTAVTVTPGTAAGEFTFAKAGGKSICWKVSGQSGVSGSFVHNDACA